MQVISADWKALFSNRLFQTILTKLVRSKSCTGRVILFNKPRTMRRSLKSEVFMNPFFCYSLYTSQSILCVSNSKAISLINICPVQDQHKRGQKSSSKPDRRWKEQFRFNRRKSEKFRMHFNFGFWNLQLTFWRTPDFFVEFQLVDKIDRPFCVIRAY